VFRRSAMIAAQIAALGVCVPLLSAAVASAGVVNTTNTVTAGPIAISSVWTETDPGQLYDIVDIFCDSLPTSTGIQAIRGSWVDNGGRFFVSKGGNPVTVVWRGRTTEGLIGVYSGVNFPGAFPTTSSLWARETDTSDNWSNLIKGCWSVYTNSDPIIKPGANDPNGDGYDENLIGRFLVSKSTTEIQFGGTSEDVFYYIVDGTTPTAIPTAFTVTKAPEPSTIVFLVSGLLGLLGYARRRRRA
jgi:hypothetical protein